MALVALVVARVDAQGVQVQNESSSQLHKSPTDPDFSFGNAYSGPGYHLKTVYTWTVMNSDPDNGYALTYKVETKDSTGTVVNTVTASSYIGPAAGVNQPTILPGQGLSNDFVVPSDNPDIEYYTELHIIWVGGSWDGDDEFYYFAP